MDNTIFSLTPGGHAAPGAQTGAAEGCGPVDPPSLQPLATGHSPSVGESVVADSGCDDDSGERDETAYYQRRVYTHTHDVHTVGLNPGFH